MDMPQDVYWSQGYAAGYTYGMKGETPDCPYPDGSREAKAWREGAQDGYRDS